MNFIVVSYMAETVFAKALSEVPRDKYYLRAKVGRCGIDGVNIRDYPNRFAVCYMCAWDAAPGKVSRILHEI